MNANSSPDLFDDDFILDSIDLDKIEEINRNPTKLFDSLQRFTCSGKVDNAKELLREFDESVRNELEETTETKRNQTPTPPSSTKSKTNWSIASVHQLELDKLSYLKREDDVEIFFNLLRMSLFELESIGGTPEQRSSFIGDGRAKESEDLRRQVSVLLAYLIESITGFCQDGSGSSKETLRIIVMELRGTLLQIGRIPQLPFFGFSLAKGGHPYYHACMDVWYATLKALMAIQHSFRENSPCVRFVDYISNDADDVTRRSSLDQLFDLLISDLISLASLRFNEELSPSDDSWCFTCPCALKLWSLLVQFWNAASKESNNESFWSRLNKAFRRFFVEKASDEARSCYSDRFVIPHELRKSIDTNAFFWRLLRSFNCFYQKDESSPTLSTDIRLLVEALASKTIVPLLGNPTLQNRLAPAPAPSTDFAHSMQMETKLRYLLAQYLIVFQTYDVPCSSVVPLELWQYFQRRLGFTFCTQEISELLVVYESASQWLEKLRRLGKLSPLDNVNDRRNSFELFLAVVVSHCSIGDAGATLWTQMKGRILSKLSPRRFLEFSECALFNCLRLLLIVADFCELDMFSEYVLEFFTEIPLQTAQGGVRKQKMVLQALSVAILIHQERDSPVDTVRQISQSLASSVASVYQAYTRKKNDVVPRRDLWELLSYYFKLLLELSYGIKGKNSLLPLLPLWSSMDFYQIFSESKECGDVRGQHRVDYLSAVAEIVKHIYESSDGDWQRIDADDRSKWTTVVRDRLVRSVRLHVHHWPWSEELADVWFHFVAAAVARTEFRLSPVVLFNEFVGVSSPSFDTNVLCRFLAKLIEKPELLPRISKEGEVSSQEDSTATITKAWLRCIFTSPQSTPSIAGISNFVSESIPWRDLLREYRQQEDESQDVIVKSSGGTYGHCQLFKDTCMALELRYAISNAQERLLLIGLCQRTFTAPIRKLTKILMNADPLDVYTHCTRLLAFLAEHCAPLLHHRDPNESLLREIIASTVCNIGAENTPVLVKRRRVEMAGECLAPMLRGLLKCEWTQNEALKKQIMECYRIELMRLAHERRNAIMEANPLITVLKDSFSSDVGTNSPSEQLRYLLLVDVRNLVIHRCGNDKQVARSSLAFVRSLIERTRSAELIQRESEAMLRFCLSVWLQHPDDRSLVSDCCELIETCRTKLDGLRRLADLVTVGFTVVATERWQQLGWSKVLGLAAQMIRKYPMIKNELVACVEKVTDEVKAHNGADMRMTDIDEMLAGKIALITGASSGIGAATAELFAKQGASALILTGRKRDQLERVGQACQKVGTKVHYFTAELSKEQDIDRLTKFAIEKCSDLNVLVNNAGILEAGSIENTSMAQYDRVMGVNVRSIYQLTMLLVPQLKKTKGCIVNVSSVNGIRSFPGVLAYNISKAAVDQLTRCVALELAKEGVRVNAVNPGVTVTELHKRSGVEDANYAKFLEHSKTTHAMGRTGQTAEVAAAIAFLASDAASFITGATLPVDGGRHAMCPR